MSQKKVISLFLSGMFIVSMTAQEGPFQKWAAGINAGLYGAGVQAATSLNSNLRLRAGFDYFSYTHKKAVTFDTRVEPVEGYEMTVEGEISDASITFPNFKALLDYYPMENGIFCLTGGLYLGANSISAEGSIKDYQQMAALLGENPEFEYEDIIIRPNSDGSFDAKIHLGNSFKPYLGLGLGRTIPINRIGFKFELGVVYQGRYELESQNVFEAGQKWRESLAEELDLPLSQNTLQWWPMMNLSLTCLIN